MKLATTTGDFARYYDNECDKLTALARAGFKYADLSMYDCASNDNWLLNDNWKNEVLKIKNCADTLGITFVQAHSPGGNPLDSSTSDIITDATVRSVYACALLNIRCTVVHAGHIGNVSFDEFCAKNMDFYNKLIPHARECGVCVLIENSGTWMGDNTYFFTGEQMAEFIDRADSPYIGACWDTGHANVMDRIQSEDIKRLGNRLKAVHIQDNYGVNDDHTAPYFGTLDIDDVMLGLTDIGFEGAFTFEADNFPLYGEGWPNSRKHYMQNGMLYHPDIDIKDGAEKLLYNIGCSLLSKYGQNLL